MDRRTFVDLVVGTCLLEPLAVSAQQADKVFRIGLLLSVTEPTATIRIELTAMRTGLRDLGWVEGKNLAIETRWAGVNPRLQRELAELKALPVAPILALGTTTIAAARDGAPGLPVVMINAGDPVGARFVASLARPGGDLTGTSAAGEGVLAKQVELVSVAVPRLDRVSALMNGVNPGNGFFFDAMSLRAKTLGLRVDRIDVATGGRTGRRVCARQRRRARSRQRPDVPASPRPHRQSDASLPIAVRFSVAVNMLQPAV